MSLIPAKKKDEALIAEMDSRIDDDQHFSLWWLGQSGYLLQWKRQRVLIDPYLSDSLTRKYGQTDRPHVRMSERVMDPALLKNIAIVSSSHNHTDHLDAETLIPVLKNNPGVKFIIPEANRSFVSERVQCDISFPVGLNAGEKFTAGDFTFYGIPASHNEIEKDEKGNCKYMGYVIRFGNRTLYHSGDTLLYDGMIELLIPYQIDIAILPINGNDPARKVAGNLNCTEAAVLGKSIGARIVVPCHYDMFEFNTADVREFEREARSIGQQYRVLEPGGCLRMI
ncbi:MAG TPA: MBL fold metallo-hydrolase [Chitinophagaceae bacterium]